MPKEWFDEQGEFHRDDGPAVLFDNGTNWWCCHGQFHRDDGPAIEYDDGSQEWYCHRQRHREDGPAIDLADGTKTWYRNGKLHRADGPAVEYPLWDIKEWWLNDRRLTKDEITALEREIQDKATAKFEAESNAITKIIMGGLTEDLPIKNPFRKKPPPPG